MPRDEERDVFAKGSIVVIESDGSNWGDVSLGTVYPEASFFLTDILGRRVKFNASKTSPSVGYAVSTSATYYQYNTDGLNATGIAAAIATAVNLANEEGNLAIIATAGGSTVTLFQLLSPQRAAPGLDERDGLDEELEPEQQ